MDPGLADGRGAETVRRLTSALPDLPLVVLTGRRDLEAAMAAVRAGASSYLEKDGLTARVLSRTLRWSLERRALRLHLQEERRSLIEVIEASPAWIAALRGPEHAFELANQAFYDLVGDRDLVGRTVREAFPEAEDQRCHQLLERVFESGETVRREEVEFGVDRHDGRGPVTRHVSFAFRPRRQDGAVIGVIVQGIDVTEQVEARRVAEQSEQKWATAIDLAPVGITLSELESGRLLAANQAAATMLGHDPDRLLGATTAELDSWVDPAERAAIVDRLRNDQVVRDEEVRLRSGTGEVHHVRVSARILTLEDRPRLLWTLHDITEHRELEEELRHQALHDSLTGLANRALFTDRLEQALARAARRNEMVGLLVMDLDRFKQINDHLGHAAGDRVLEEVARRLERELREEDTPARLGGDEFAVLVPALGGADDLTRVRDRLMRALDEPFLLVGQVVDVDVTVGGVLHAESDRETAVHVDDPDDLVRYADLALFRAKKTAGPSFRLFRPDEDRKRAGFLGREQELRRAVRDQEFELLFQPIVRLEEGTTWGMEPLARWRHPERGLLSPAEFIPLAEETGLIHDLGELLLRMICRRVAEWPDADEALPLRVTPNLSGRQFDRDGLVGTLLDIVRGADLEPGRFWLEITESAITRATDRVQELRDLGFGVVVDDFGTGFSSFHYLRDLEFDGLKIDMSFVQGLLEDRTNVALVETMLTMGRAMEMTVVAEGIETDEQRRLLADLGCSLGQGFFFARPSPPEAVPRMIVG